LENSQSLLASCQSPDLKSQVQPTETDIANSAKQNLSLNCDQNHVAKSGQNHDINDADVLSNKDTVSKDFTFTQLSQRLIDEAYERLSESSEKDPEDSTVITLSGVDPVRSPVHVNPHDSSHQILHNIASAHNAIENHSPVITGKTKSFTNSGENNSPCYHSPKLHSNLVSESASPVNFKSILSSASPIFKPALQSASPANSWKSLARLKPKPKRFAYPTSSQISKTCPRQVFQLKDETDAAAGQDRQTEQLEAADKHATEPLDERSNIQQKAEPARKLPWKRKSTGLSSKIMNAKNTYA
jgi:hypothetical protein